jgi:flagellar biosynthesis protein FlhG
MNSGLQTDIDVPRRSVQGQEAAVISIGGGKGGIGKTLLTANLGICLARTGLKVVLVDADLGGSNLHTCLGIDFPDVSLSDFVQRRVQKIEEVIVETGVEGLGLISGAQDFLGSANIKYTQKMRMLRQVCRINTDVVLMDLGGGTSFNVLDFFLVSDLGIVMMVPEPTSLENSYRFIKSAFYRLLRQREKSLPFRRVIDDAMENRNELGIRTPYDLIRAISKMDPERGEMYQAWMLSFRPLLVINQVRSREDEELGIAIRTACQKYFGIDLDYLGHIDYEDSVWRAVRSRSAFIQDNPDTNIARSFWAIARAVMARLNEIKGIDRWSEHEGLP